MIRRRRVLDPSEVPDDELIVHRGDQLRDVRMAFDELASGAADTPWILTGPPGTGKTMVARFVLDEFDERDDVRTAFVDCWTDYTDYHLLERVVDELGLAVVHHNSTPKSRLLEALHDDPETARLVILDEADMVRDSDAFGQLAAAPSTAVAMIVNDPNEVEDLIETAWGDPTPARERLHYPRYTVRELSEILSKRAEHGLRRPVDDRVLEHMAEAADGDARLGICILRAAARDARYSIDEDDVEPALRRAQRELHQSNLERLTDHQRALYDVIEEHGPISPQAARSHYVDRVDDPRSLRALRKYLRKMEVYGLVESSGETRARKIRIDRSGYVDPGTA